MSERLPSEFCPRCASDRAAVRLDSGLGAVRAYRCPDCLAEWSVDGSQLALFELDGPLTFAFDEGVCAPAVAPGILALEVS